MARRISRSGIAIGVVVLALGIGAAVLLIGQEPPEDVRDESSLTVEDRDDASKEASRNAGDAAVTTTAPLVATNDAGEIVPPKATAKKTTTPSSTTGGSTGSATGDTTPDAQQQYLHVTRKVVETNAEDLTSVVDAVTVALSAGDSAALETLMADDESDAATYAATLADRYPPLLTATPASNLNVFSVGDTTVYFAYQVVTWRDAGITSQHTIAIPMRFINGEWRLTSLDDSTQDLTFVQSVTL